MRKCSTCKQELPVDQFYGRNSVCKPCRKVYIRDHYQSNKQYYKDKAKASNQKKSVERQEFLIDYFTSHPCVDCGTTDPRVLEFDHVSGDKELNVSGMWTYSDERFFAEIAKCEVRCKNCHAIVTYERAGSWRSLIGLHDGLHARTS